MPIRCLRRLLCLAIVAFVAASMPSSASAHGQPARAADVSPSGEQYDPDALAIYCIADVRSGGSGLLTYNGAIQRLSGLRVVRVPVDVWPMLSGIPDVDCPAPAWVHVRARLLFSNDHLRAVPVSAWQAAPDADTDNTRRSSRFATLVFRLFRRYQPCYPVKVEDEIKKRVHSLIPVTVVRGVYLQVSIRAHSGRHGISFLRKQPFDIRDRCVRRGRR